MLQAQKVSKAYGGQDVLSGIDLTLAPGQRAALVGRNGTGKTTLLRILCGRLVPDSGAVSSIPGTRVGYLGQEGQLEPGRTLYREMAEVFSAVFRMEEELRELELRMEGLQGEALERCISRYGELQAVYEHAQPHTLDARIRTVLAGMGFGPRDLERPCRELSGGWQMRGAMARLLLEAPDVLLLDEPTNHLDLAAVEWLEEFLIGYPGAVLLVSHDRAFVDRAVNRILELRDGRLEDYAGNYTYFLEERERRRELQQRAHEAQERRLAEEMRFVERFRAKATLATRVQSRIKKIERMERVDAPGREAPAMALQFQEAGSGGREPLVVKGLRKSYGGVTVLDGVGFRVERGERVAVVGPNGAGKSTLLRLMAGAEEPDEGSVTRGYRVSSVYYAQHQAEALDPDRTVLEEVEAAAPPGRSPTSIRTLLGCLLFPGDDVHKKVGVLSGGERSRVALARCIVAPSNLLLLDEPTNHLDLAAREALLEALEEYPGTILFVTHDRFFMDSLADQVLEVGGGLARLHLGNYSGFRYRKLQEQRAAEARARSATAAKAPRKVRPRRPRPGEASSARAVPWKREALEARIFALEEEIHRLAGSLAAPELYHEPAEAARVRARYEGLTAECAELTAIWDQLQE